MTDELSRRQVLRNGGAGLFAAGVVGLSGCLSDVPVVGGSGSGAQNWLSEPDFETIVDEDELGEDFELDDYEVQNRSFSTISPDAVFDNEEYASHWTLRSDWAADLRDRTGVPATELEWELSQDIEWEFEDTDEWEYNASIEANILSGDFDVENVEINLEDWADDESPSDEDLSSEGTYEGFDLYEYSPDDVAFAVRDDYVIEIHSSRNVETVIALEEVIDTRLGDGRGWDEDPDAEELLAQTPDGHLTLGRLRVDARDDDDPGVEDWEDGLLGSALSLEVDGETSEFTRVFLYERERDAHEGDLREYVDANRDIDDDFETLQDYSIDEDERMLIVSGTVRTTAFL